MTVNGVKLTLVLLCSAWLLSCAIDKSESVVADGLLDVNSKQFGVLSTGQSVTEYTLQAGRYRLVAIDYGAIITQLWLPDRNGQLADVVLGYDELADYELKNRYFGAVVGRYANRVSEGKLVIDGKPHQLTLNKPPHHLHGGNQGFDKVLWQGTTRLTDKTAELTFSYLSPDGQQGYPGNLQVSVTYRLHMDGYLDIVYRGNSDKVTVFNPTQHSYFNLNPIQPNVLQHQLQVNAEQIIELDEQSVPTGRLLHVENGPFDLREPRLVAEGLNQQHPQLEIGKGFDHYFLSQSRRGDLSPFAQLTDPASGRVLKVLTTERGGQIYSANYLNPSVIGKDGRAYQKYQGLCIETGQLPDAPNRPEFATVWLQPGQPFYSQSRWLFELK